jgi:hypothetical protein
MSQSPQGASVHVSSASGGGKTLQKLAMSNAAPVAELESATSTEALPVLSATMKLVKMSTFLKPTGEETYLEPAVPT